MNADARRPVNFGKLSDQQVSFLDTTEWHLESWRGDGRRLRVVYPTLGLCSRWFSSDWDAVPYEYVRPSVDPKMGGAFV